MQFQFPPQSFRPVPRTGVIFVMTEAGRLGYQHGDGIWANLGQGAPETGPLPDAPERMTSIQFSYDELEYAPVDGLRELREAVAELYNTRYRKGLPSQYTAENVSICAGGRLAISRLVSTLGRGHIGHFLPDYTAYEELLGSFQTFSPTPILRDPARGYDFLASELRQEVMGRGLSAVLLSNPSNPVGKVLSEDELRGWVEVGRDLDCAMLFDEFYSHYLYETPRSSISAAEYVEDVNRDPVIIFDGLTKNWRYPGFRVSWTIGPRSVIELVASAGSFFDGGCARPMQKAALSLVQPENADLEAHSIKRAFRAKRDKMIEELQAMGILINPQPEGSFYCWGDLRNLPDSINTGMSFFHKALEAKVIVVPGVFFDINPGKRRPDRVSRFGKCVRFSFGPSMEELSRGLTNLKQMVQSAA